jgi:Ala-tRNA(Pro) deacylase
MQTAHETCDALTRHRIPFGRYDHPPVATCEEASHHLRGIEGVGSKNLFLRNKRGDRYFLVSVPETKRVALNELSKMLGEGKLSFASADALEQFLGVAPGAVTILGLVNDTGRSVTAFVDRELWDADAIQCHPLVNTATVVIAPRDIDRFLHCFNHGVSVIEVPAVSPGL